MEGSMQRNATIQNWISELTRAGYDLVGMHGHTARGDWNSNHPMVSTNYHFRNEAKRCRDVVVTAYSCHGSAEFTIYAHTFRGRNCHRYAGFDVLGSREVELTLYAIIAWRFEQSVAEHFTSNAAA
jgi:hypothetical protein